MQSIRLHLDGNGMLWALAKCRTCGEVHKYPMTEVATGPVECRSCGRPMEIEGAVVGRRDAVG